MDEMISLVHKVRRHLNDALAPAIELDLSEGRGKRKRSAAVCVEWDDDIDMEDPNALQAYARDVRGETLQRQQNEAMERQTADVGGIYGRSYALHCEA